MRPLEKIDFSVLQQCMHCGLCLPSCPTYRETLYERHSPRGRLALMRSVATGQLPATPVFAEELSYCLGCLACTSACPAGVDYGQALEAGRAHAAKAVPPSRSARGWRWLTLRQLMPYPRRLRRAARLLRWWQRSRLRGWVHGSTVLARLFPTWLARDRAAPPIEAQHTDQRIAEWEYPAGPVRYRVLFLSGCVQDVAYSSVHRDTVDVLLANGCAVHTPREQRCCGSLHAHQGDQAMARTLAGHAVSTYSPEDYDAILSNAAGCGSHLRHYDRLLRDDPELAARARAWSARLRDIHPWLVEIGFRPPQAALPAVTVTYQEACHLCHGQKVSEDPRKILRAIPGVTLVELPDATVCCGSAGVYSLLQPSTAGHLREQKWQQVLGTGAQMLTVANPGCLAHLGADPRAAQVPLAHPISLLAQAYRAERGEASPQPPMRAASASS